MNAIIKKILASTNLSEQEAWWMLESITKKTKEQLVIAQSNMLSDREEQMLDEWTHQLNKEHIPLSYLLGTVPFLDLTIKVEPPVLIPRPETEEWVFHVIKKLQPYKKFIKNILDIGTGSGCIALSLAKHFDSAHIVATDINQQALRLAEKNATANNINNIRFIKSDLFTNLQDQTFDLIVSNPPYIDPTSKKSINPQVIKWEDNKALFAQNKGLSVIETILKHAKNYLNIHKELPTQLVIEFDYNQAEDIKSLATTYNWNCLIKKDSFGNNRTAWLIASDPVD